MGGDIAIAKNLRRRRFSQEQSKTLAESISESIVVGVATKLILRNEDGIKDRNFKLRVKMNVILAILMIVLSILLAPLLKQLF